MEKLSFINKKLISLFLINLALFLSNFTFASAQSGEKSIITIESAQKTEYKKDAESGNDYIVLSGNVKVSVARGSKKTTITSDVVNYNRANDMIYAEGNVILEQSSGSSGGGETITAKSLLFNTATLEGIFDNGRAVQTSSDAINLPSGSTLIVASDIFGRDSGGTIAFKSGELTFCDDESPHWKIKASRIWLLPGGEFAFLNARLFVGRVPLMWFPAFYYPKDELIFNPAFGYKFREGYFINTTTYLYGRKGADASSTASKQDDDDKIDFFSFMKTGAMKEQVREGLVLHNLDEDYKGDTSSWFKVMADYYSNLGAMVGFDGSFKPGSVLTELAFNVELGFSNTVFKSDTGMYTSYNSAGDIVADGSNFMSFKAPFRYQANLKVAIARPFSLSLSMPVYSDPYFDWDFNKRAETMDWIDYMMSGAETEDNSNDATTVTSFTWQLNGNYTFKLPEFLNPYISSLSLSNFSSSIVYSSKVNDEIKNRSEYKADSNWGANTPERSFYYPSQVVPFKVSGRISGTLFKYPFTESIKSIPSSGITLNIPESLDDSEKKENAEDETDKNLKDDKPLLPDAALPEMATNSFSKLPVNGVSYNLSYSVSPDFSSQISYASTPINTPEDFVWSQMQSTYYQVRSPATLTSTLGFRDSFLSLTDTFSFDPVYQKHPYLNDDVEKGGYSESSIKSIKNADNSARKLDLTDTNSLSFRPFYYTKHFSDTSLSWNTTVKMIRTKYISDDPENPEWEYLTTDIWDSECVTSHNLNLKLAASEGKYSQSLTLTTTLPPQVDSYSGVFSLGFPYGSFSVSSGIKQKSSTDETWVKQNLSQNFSFRLLDSKLSLSQSYVYNMEDEYHDSLRFSLSGYGTQLAYTMSYTNDYEFKKGQGWISESSKDFQPYSLSVAYTSPSKSFKYWTDRIAFDPSLSTSLVYDFVRPTNSYFVFIPKVTFKVNNFIDISFSAESRNSAIYRYFCPDSKYQEYYDNRGERNIFKDLFDSFRFDDEDKRKATGFKLKSLNMTISHDLDDWDLNCSFKITPRYISASGTGANYKSAYYDFSPYFSISVAWRPMAGMKTEIVDDYGEWSLNP